MVQLIESPDGKVCTVVECAKPFLGIFALRLSSPLSVEAAFDVHGTTMCMTHHNAVPIGSQSSIEIQDADVITLSPSVSEIRAGGHPQGKHVPHLAESASFVQRCEWAVNTFGWAAADEIRFGFSLMSLPPDVDTCIAYWNEASIDIDSGPFGPLEFNEQGATWCAILCDHHWVSADIHKHGDKAYIDFRGATPEQARTFGHAIARRLDLHPSRVPIGCSSLDSAENMCGWEALFYWHQAAENDVRLLPDFAKFQALPESSQDHIWQVLSSSAEEWQKTDAPTALRNFAWILRFNFFVHLAEFDLPKLESHVGSVVASLDTSLVDNLPRRVLEPPNATVRPTPADSLLSRLLDLRDTAGFLPSDLLDGLLELLRIARSDVLFAPPAKWDPAHDAFLFFNNFECNPVPYHQVHLLCLWGNRWIQCELIKSAGHALAFLAIPDATHIPHRLIDHIAAWISMPRDRVHVYVLCQMLPSVLCGWSYVQQLFHRYGLMIPHPSPAQHFVVLHHRFAGRLGDIRSAAHRAWNSVGIWSRFCTRLFNVGDTHTML